MEYIKYEELIGDVAARRGSLIETAKGFVDLVLKVAGVEIPTKPALPEISPGDWKIQPGNDDQIGNDEHVICTMNHHIRRYLVGNKALFLAAPDLRDLLYEVAAKPMSITLSDRVHAALRKAGVRI